MVTIERPPTLTTAFCKAVTKPGRYGDRRGSYGLSLMVRATGKDRLSKAWAQRLRFDGQAFNIGLGSFPLIPLAKARSLAFQNAQQVAQGIDIRETKRQRQMIPTVKAAAEATIKAHVWTRRQEADTRARLTRYILPTLGGDRIDRIRSPDVIEVLAPVWQKKAAQARKVRVLLRQIFDWARAHGYITDNPVTGIDAALGKHDKGDHHEAPRWQDVPEELRYLRSTKARELLQAWHLNSSS